MVVQILKSKINCGLIEYNKNTYKGLHEPIVSEKVYNEVSKLMAKRSKNKIKTNSFLLSGLVYCGKCGNKMRYQKWGKKGHALGNLSCYCQVLCSFSL